MFLPRLLVLPDSAVKIDRKSFKAMETEAPPNHHIVAVRRNKRGQKNWLINRRCTSEECIRNFMQWSESYEYLFCYVPRPTKGDRFPLPAGSYEVSGHCFTKLHDQLPGSRREYRLVVVRHRPHGEWFRVEHLNSSGRYGKKGPNEDVTYWVVPWKPWQL